MTTTDIALRAPAELAEKIEYAKFLAAADLLPKAYQGKPANLLYAIEYGAMLGLPPMAAVVGIHVIDGRPTMSAGLMAAKVREAGHKVRVEATGEGDQARARCQITRKDDQGFTYSATWTMDRAKTAGLLGKTNWRQHPIQMLKNRAISEACRDACQEVLLGIHYTPDELGGEDDGGEIISDGWPTLPSGQVDAGQMSDQARDAAGLMTTHQRAEHAGLRRMNQVDPADVEIVGEREGDPWQIPPPGKPEEPKRATDAAIAKMNALADSLQLGSGDDVRAVAEWLGGSPWTFSTGQVRTVTSTLNSYIEHAGGDLEEARTAIWVRYNEMHPEDGSDD